jgi:HAD superfamily hydrolase (TIGR01458 family)
VLDLDGTVYDERGLIAGAAEAVTAIRSAGLGLRFATNTSREPRAALVERLRSLGVDAGLDEVLTAPRAAAAWLASHGLTQISLHVAAATVEEFAAFTIVEQSPQAVVVGDLGDEWSVDRLNRVFRHVLGGAHLLAIQKNRYWRHGGALCLDAGPFVAAIEYATGAIAVVAGKPSKQFFEAAASALAVSAADLVVVGDDVRADVEGARLAGARGVLVRTGKFHPADLDDADLHPDRVLDSIADLPAALGI